MTQDNSFSNIPSSKKATIVIKKKTGDETLTCHFNPEKYTITRTIGWQQQSIKGQNVPPSEFTGGGPSKMDLNLLFDTSFETTAKDVRTDTKKLWDATRVETDSNDTSNKGQPPHIVFIWGRSWTFEAVITSLSEEFILFNEDGIPIRSNIRIQLTQVKDDTSFGKQNPTSGATPGKVYTVREGDRLDLIAAQYYKKPMLWRYIAEHNDIDNPRQLVPGQQLIIPPLP
ncbi:MAG TPA: LysM peptidoglycan-binding domain-containing protein [Chloroflexia bacterium]|nr:LysM peptidoglycan-binding domain-containing protein [Chloroflexia bacterium]